MNHFIIDFDSTFIKDESLDVLAKFSFGKEDKFVDKIANITNDGMEGKISFKESLTRRIELFDSNKKCLEMTIEFLKNRVSKSFKENKQFLKKNSDNIYILSSGFLDIIEPIVIDFNIKKENIFGNNFTFDEFDNITGFEKTNTLSSDLGKVHIIKNLNLVGNVHVIGDGYTDYEIKKEGYADFFYLFTENKERKTLVKYADYSIKSLDEFINIVL
tara:strand:- start:5433 stop:6080 length:648 start_codon:yes stop_codon:yes gene_type:complete